MSKLKCRNQSPDRKEIVGNKKPKIEKVVKEEIVAGSEAAEERKMEKVSKKKLVIGYGAVKTASHNQDLRLDCSPFPRKEGSMSKTKSKNRSPDRQDIVGNLKPKIEKVTSVVAVVGSEASKNLDIAQSSNYMRDRIPGTSAAALKKRKTEGFENVGIEIHAASEVRKSDDVHTNRRDVVAQAPSRTKPQSANESGKAVRALIKCYRKAFSSQYQGYKILQEQCFGLKVWKWERNIVETGQVIALFLFVLSRTPQNLNKPKRLGAPLCPRNGFRSATSKENLLRSKVYKSNCGSLEEVTQWVYDDLESTRSWLQQRDPKPELEDLEFIAAQGIMVRFEDIIKGLQDNQGVASIVGSWECVPQAVKELRAMEGGREGYLKCTRSSMLREADRLKCVYTDVLSPIFVADSKKPLSDIQKKKQ